MAEIIIKTLKERTRGESWILLVYGQTKSGKTYFAGTAGPRTLFINIGDGITTLESPAFINRYPESGDMITIDLSDRPDLPTAFDDVCTTIDNALSTYSDKFDTIVLDEATALRKFAMNKAISLSKNPRISNKFNVPEMRDYNIEMAAIEWFCGQYVPIFKKHKKNFIMLAHERQIFGKPDKQGDEAPLKRIMPGFTGQKNPDAIPKYFDDVWRIESFGSINVQYRMFTAGHSGLVVGSRHGGIFNPEEFDPNFLKMLERIKNNQTIKPK